MLLRGLRKGLLLTVWAALTAFALGSPLGIELAVAALWLVEGRGKSGGTKPC